MNTTITPTRALAGLLIAALVAAAMYAITLPAFADTLFGGGLNQDPYSVLISNTQNATTSDDYSGISYNVATGTTLASLGELSARYNVADTDCGGGSPRFQINVSNGTTSGNIFAYVGPEPSYTGCAQNTWSDSGNLLNGTRTIDTSQLPGGTFYDTWAHASSEYGGWTVTGVQLVADGGWATGGVQRIRVTHANVGGTAYTYPQTPATSTPPMTDAQALADALEALQAQYPQFYWNLQWVINDLMNQGGGTTTPPASGGASIDNDGASIGPMGHLDFVGRNFGSDETVELRLNGSLLRTIRADGGGNFSTGSMTGPTDPGTYTFMFTGTTSGRTANSVITVQ